MNAGEYFMSPNNRKLAIKAIFLKKKRQRNYDRILFMKKKSNTIKKSKIEEEELKKDRSDFIKFIKRKHRT